jgi:hypothetical protein
MWIFSTPFSAATSTTSCRFSPTASALEACSALSLSLEEPLFATAPEASAWLLVEQPGTWGAKALTESRLDSKLGAELERRTKALAIKTLLVKSPGHTEEEGRRCFLGCSRQGAVFLEQVVLRDPEDLLGLPLEALAAGQRLGLGVPVPDPLYLVCTNGLRDACCARRGRPLAKVLAERYPGRVWECSHLGGHRFAANLVCLPDGLCFGRADAVAAHEYEEGRIALPFFRGRSSFPPPAQAADWFVREREGLRGIDELVLGQVSGGEVALRHGDGTSYQVRVAKHEAEPPRPFSCGEEKLERPPLWRLLELDVARESSA